MLYSAEQYAVVLAAERNPRTLATPCIYPAAMRFQFQGNLTSTAVTRYYNLYTLVLANCALANATVSGTVSFMNGNDPLSVEEMPLLSVYWTFMCGYSLLFVVWVGGLINYRRILIRHQLLLFLVMIVKVLELAFGIAYYNGYSSSNMPNIPLRNWKLIASTLAESAFSAFLLWTALGWSLLRPRMTRREIQLFVSTFGVYIGIGILQKIGCSPTFCSAYALSYYVIRFLITFGIIVGTNHNIERLRGMVADHSWAVARHCQTKLLLYRRFRWTFLFFLVAPLLLLFLEFALFRWSQTWLTVFLSELTTLGVFVVLAVAFRPGTVLVPILDPGQ
jgi:hypothetical protein